MIVDDFDVLRGVVDHIELSMCDLLEGPPLRRANTLKVKSLRGFVRKTFDRHEVSSAGTIEHHKQPVAGIGHAALFWMFE